MADDSEIIGGVEIDITGNYAGLTADLDAAQAIAAAAGAKIADALNAAFSSAGSGAIDLAGSTDNLNQAMVGAGQSAKSFIDALNVGIDEKFGADAADAGAVAQTNLAASLAASADAAKQFDDAMYSTDGFKQMDDMSTRAQTSLENLKEEFRSIPPEANNAQSAISGINNSLIEMAASVAIIATLKQAIADALSAFDSLDRASIALGVITGSADAATASIAQMRDIAQSDALSFPSLLTADLRFTEFGVTAAQMPALLNATADAAAATNRAFDTVANSMERMVESGTANARQLVNVGLSLTDLATVMGVASSEVKQAFLDLTPQQRAQALTEALDKLAGTAQETAETVSGQWQKIKNDYTFMTDAIVAQNKSAILEMEKFILAWEVIASLSTKGTPTTGSGEATLQETLGGAGGASGDFGGETGGAIPSVIVQTTAQIVAQNNALKDATASAAAYQAALYAAYAQLGITNYSGVLGNQTDQAGMVTQLSDLNAFIALANSGLGLDRLSDAADTLRARLLAAFEDGAISVEQYDKALNTVNLTMDNLENKLGIFQQATKAFNIFDISNFSVEPDAIQGLYNLTAGLEAARLAAIQLANPGIFQLNAMLDQADTDAGGASGDLVVLEKAATDAATAMQALTATVPGENLANAWGQVTDAINDANKAATDAATQILLAPQQLLTQLLQTVHVTAQATLDAMLEANDGIQASNDATDKEKLQSARNTLEAIMDLERDNGVQVTADQSAQLAALKLSLGAQADLWNEVQKNVSSIFTSMSSGLAAALFDWKNFGTDVTNVLEQIGQKIVSSLIQNLLLTQNNLNAITTAFTSLLQGGNIGTTISNLGASLHIGNTALGAPATAAQIAGAQGEGGYMGSGTFAGPLPAPASDGGAGFGSQSDLMSIGAALATMGTALMAMPPALAANTNALTGLGTVMTSNVTAVTTQFQGTQTLISQGNVLNGNFQQLTPALNENVQSTLDLSGKYDSLDTAVGANTTAAQAAGTASTQVAGNLAENNAIIPPNTEATLTNNSDLGNLSADLGGIGGGGASGAGNYAGPGQAAQAGGGGGTDAFGDPIPSASNNVLGLGTSVAGLAGIGIQIANMVIQAIEGKRMIDILYNILQVDSGTESQLVSMQGTFNMYLPQLVHLTDIWGTLTNMLTITSVEYQALMQFLGNSGNGSFVGPNGPGNSVVQSDYTDGSVLNTSSPGATSALQGSMLAASKASDDNTTAVHTAAMATSDLKGGLMQLSTSLQKSILAIQGNVGGPEGNALQFASSAGSTGIINAATAQAVQTLIAGLAKGGQGIAPDFTTSTSSTALAAVNYGGFAQSAGPGQSFAPNLGPVSYGTMAFTPANLASALQPTSDALLGKLSSIADGLSKPVSVTVQTMNPLQAWAQGVRNVGVKI